MRFSDRLRRFFASNAIERQLYPAPEIRFTLRQYRPEDRPAVLAIHDANATGRFPGNARSLFEEFLDQHISSFFVAVGTGDEVLACCGVMSASERFHTLCFGLIHPQHQGKRIGSTLTLARLVYASRAVDTHFAAIYAVPDSIRFYERFGFSVKGEWLREGERSFPFAILGYDQSVIRRLHRVLSARGHLIDSAIPVHADTDRRAEFTQDEIGFWQITFHPLQTSKADAGAGDSKTTPASGTE